MLVISVRTVVDSKNRFIGLMSNNQSARKLQKSELNLN